MHVLVAVEAHEGDHKLFEEWIKQRKYDSTLPGSDKPITITPGIRKIELWELVTDTQAGKQLLQDLRAFQYDDSHLNDGRIPKHSRFTKAIGRIVGIAKLFGFPVERFDPDKVKPRDTAHASWINWCQKAGGYRGSQMIKTIILGTMKDGIMPDGREAV